MSASDAATSTLQSSPLSSVYCGTTLYINGDQNVYARVTGEGVCEVETGVARNRICTVPSGVTVKVNRKGRPFFHL
jgi:hypothetical protein